MSAINSNGWLKIGDLAARAGVGVQTLHYYERLGLLPRPERSQSNHRIYSAETLHRVSFIKKAQAAGFTLNEIKQIFGLQKQGAVRCRVVIEVGERRLRELEYQLKILQAFRDSLAAILPKWKKEIVSRRKCIGEFCDLIERLPLEPGSSAEEHKQRRRGIAP